MVRKNSPRKFVSPGKFVFPISTLGSHCTDGEKTAHVKKKNLLLQPASHMQSSGGVVGALLAADEDWRAPRGPAAKRRVHAAQAPARRSTAAAAPMGSAPPARRSHARNRCAGQAGVDAFTCCRASAHARYPWVLQRLSA